MAINKIVQASSFQLSWLASAMIFSQPASCVAATFITSASASALAILAFATALVFSTLPSTKVLAKELAPYNIRVNGVAPGLTQTDMMLNSTPEDALKETLNRICMKRVGQPEEIANSVLFLASDLSQVLRVDGGM